jgi:hypothetical protein
MGEAIGESDQISAWHCTVEQEARMQFDKSVLEGGKRGGEFPSPQLSENHDLCPTGVVWPIRIAVCVSVFAINGFIL